MRFLGQTEMAAFVAAHPGHAEVLLAWVAEMKHRCWNSPESMSEDFQNADVSHPPVAVFLLGGTPTNESGMVETLVDFRNGIVLLTRIRQRQTGVGLLQPEI